MINYIVHGALVHGVGTSVCVTSWCGSLISKFAHKIPAMFTLISWLFMYMYICPFGCCCIPGISTGYYAKYKGTIIHFDCDGFFGEKNSCRNHLCWTAVTHIADACSMWHVKLFSLFSPNKETNPLWIFSWVSIASFLLFFYLQQINELVFEIIPCSKR